MICIRPFPLIINSSSLCFILRTARNLLSRLRIEDKSNHLECLQKQFLVQFRFRSPCSVVNIFTDRKCTSS